MPNQTLYDNFSQVRQYIDQNQVDLSSYVSKSELEGMSYATTSYVVDYVDEHGGGVVTYSYLSENYLPLSGGEVTGPLNVSFVTTNNSAYGFNSYSHIIAGNQDKTSVTFFATKRNCGGTPNMASFFTNSDGRSKFAHKTYTGTKADVGSDVDDAFMCFNAYGFKISYSGTPGTSASTEYDIIHSGNIGDYISVIDENIIPKETSTYTLGSSTYKYFYTYTANIGSPSDGLTIRVGDYNRFKLTSTSLYPVYSSTTTLGTSSAPWAYTYTNRVNFGNNKVYIYNNGDTQMKFGVNNTDRFRIDYNTFCPSISGVTQLGTSGNPFTYTYFTCTHTDEIILNGTDIKDSINGMFSYDSATGTLTITSL